MMHAHNLVQGDMLATIQQIMNAPPPDAKPLSHNERKLDSYIKLMAGNGEFSIRDLARLRHLTVSTVRRDMQDMARSGIVERTHFRHGDMAGQRYRWIGETE